METGKAIYKLLKDSADVGAICADRIYPELAQQDADAPFIVYTVTDTTPSPTKNATSKLDTARVELYCISDDYEQAMNLGIAVRTALDRQSGTISGVEVQSVDFDTSDIQFDPDQRVYVLEHTYDVRVLRTGTAVTYVSTPGNAITVEEVDGDPSGSVNKIVFSNDTVTIVGTTATVTSGGGAAVDTQYHDRYNTEAEALRSGATANVELYYTARADGDGIAESATSDEGETDTINRTLYYSDKHRADPDTAADWTEYTTQPADNASFATAKAALLQGLNETDATAETRGTLPLSLKMVRTTTAAVTDLLLDTYTGAAAAYSVRKLDKDYTGNCMRVRRDSDEATQDIGFDSNGDLDTAAIATFCSGTFGYVSRWYDQSGNGNDATQSTGSAQPMIYDRVAAAVVTDNGKPALQLSGTQNLDFTTVTLETNWAIITVNHTDVTGGNNTYMGNDSSSRPVWNELADATLDVRLVSTVIEVSDFITFDQHLIVVNSSSNTVTASSNSTLTNVGSKTGSWAWNRLFKYVFGNYSGFSQEIIMYQSDQSSNRTGIETNINDYFDIYT